MDTSTSGYIATALSVIICFILAAYSTGGLLVLTIAVGLLYMLVLYIFLSLCLVLKMIWQALLGSD